MNEELADFLNSYEVATNSHNFSNVAPLIVPDATYWFTDGTHVGHESIQAAFENAWNTVKDEVYGIKDVQWIAASDTIASCVYTFTWQGLIDGKPRSGEGRGTNVLVKQDGKWQIVHEHLSR